MKWAWMCIRILHVWNGHILTYFVNLNVRRSGGGETKAGVLPRVTRSKSPPLNYPTNSSPTTAMRPPLGELSPNSVHTTNEDNRDKVNTTGPTTRVAENKRPPLSKATQSVSEVLLLA